MLPRRPRDPLQSLHRRGQELKQQVSSGCPAGLDCAAACALAGRYQGTRILEASSTHRPSLL